MECDFHQNDKRPVDEGDGAVRLQLALPVVCIDDEAGAAHEIHDSDEVHDGGILQDVDGFIHEPGERDRQCLRRDDGDDAMEGGKPEDHRRLMLSA